ncbi:PREDICTED: RPM1-interacting protein 4-like isoform X1 [Nicotiana attenuata]|uniref:RPM1-interacting protein 4-like isoform X1 n=1 Tax=Nicotiana attenuata TaxID=49451 RepID=UPI0009058D62|nr:PREDICTED: RPM1-interacting protein 4-like isoform X1 [Nicotiana attenuata]
MSEKGRPLPKFGEWDVNDPASAEGFTVIFNKARDEKKTGGKPESPSKADGNTKQGEEPLKPQTRIIQLQIGEIPSHSTALSNS